MALPSRPKLRFDLRGPALTGTPLRGELVLAVGAPILVRSITVELEGLTSATFSGLARSNKIYPSSFSALEVLCTSRPLAPGEHRLPFLLRLPADLCPSYASPTEHRDFVLKASVDVAWWLPASLELPIEVHPQAPDELSARPTILTSQARRQEASGYAVGEIELVVDVDTAHPGDQLTGQVAVTHGDPEQLDRLELSFDEFLSDGIDEGDKSYRELLRSAPVATFAADEALTGAPLGFSVRLPRDLLPSFRSIDKRRFCELRARLVWKLLALEDELAAPVQIVPHETRLVRPPPERLPLLGRPREEEAMRRVAEASGAQLREGQIRRGFGPVQAAVSPRTGPRTSQRFVAELSYPPLGLELRAGPAPLWWRRRSPAARLKELPAGHVAGRDVRQIEAFLRPLQPHFAPFSALTADDEAMTLEAVGDGDEPALLDFARHVFVLAQAWAEALDHVPPPTALASSLPAFRRLAHELNAELQVGSLTLRGTIDDHAFTLEPTWDEDEPSGTLVVVAAPLPLDERYHVALDGHDPHAVTLLPDHAREPLSRLLWPTSRITLNSAGGTFTTRQLVHEHAPALGWLRALVDLLSALAPSTSPYR